MLRTANGEAGSVRQVDPDGFMAGLKSTFPAPMRPSVRRNSAPLGNKVNAAGKTALILLVSRR
jgi:hypothetical protein